MTNALDTISASPEKPAISIKLYKKGRTWTRRISVGCKTYHVEVYYDLGGMNYFASQVEKRGYRLLVVPVNVADDKEGNLVTLEVTPWSGIRVLIEEATRFSDKKLDALAEEYLNLDNEVTKGWIAYVTSEWERRHK